MTTKINEVQIAETGIGNSILKTLKMAYRESPFFSEVYGALSPILSKKYTLLHQLNNELLEAILSLLESRPKIIFSSTLGAVENKGELVIEIIKKLKEQCYLSGEGALAYMDIERFRAEAIEVLTYNFTQEVYPQLWTKGNEFTPDLSVVDLLFNNLPDAREYILSNGKAKHVSRMEASK